MTTENTAPTAEDYATAAEALQQGTTAAETTGEGSQGNWEAAKYRKRAQAALAASVERLTMYQRQDAERIASKSLSRGDDVWLAGADIKDLLADDGSGLVCDEKVNAVVEGAGRSTTAWSTVPGLRRRQSRLNTEERRLVAGV